MVYGGVESLSFGVDEVSPEVIPVAVFHHGTLCQDRLGPRYGPSHPGVFHAIFDQGSTGTLDGARGDGISFFQIGRIVHHMAMILKIGDGLLDGLVLVRGEWMLGADLFECTHDIADVALEEGV